MLSLKRKIQKLINFPFNVLGLEITRKGLNSSWHERLKHMKTLGFSPQVIFDCGAFMGEWTLKASKIFPDMQFLLVEPNTMLIDKTKTNISGINPPPILLEVAVGEEPKTTYLNVWSDKYASMTGSSLLAYVQEKPKKKIKTKVHTLDAISEKYNLVPDLVKLDLQGAELPALKGANNILQTTELFIIEFGCLEAYIDRTEPRELMEIMYDNYYCLYDVVDLIYRPYDGALTGGDFFFIKNNSPLRKYKGYL